MGATRSVDDLFALGLRDVCDHLREVVREGQAVSDEEDADRLGRATVDRIRVKLETEDSDEDERQRGEDEAPHRVTRRGVSAVGDATREDPSGDEGSEKDGAAHRAVSPETIEDRLPWSRLCVGGRGATSALLRQLPQHVRKSFNRQSLRNPRGGSGGAVPQVRPDREYHPPLISAGGGLAASTILLRAPKNPLK